MEIASENKKVDIWTIFLYFTIYSIIGFFLETMFAIPTKLVIESRQSFLYGPFCMIYGVGGVMMILLLRNIKRYEFLFIGGLIIGGLVEYYGSLVGEILFGVKWWDYTGMLLSIHGRTCLFYLICWGFLSIFLIKYINPKVDKFLNNFKQRTNLKIFKVVSNCIMTFLVINGYITGYALRAFYVRIAKEYDLDIRNKRSVNIEYNDLYNDMRIASIINKYFNDEKMLKTFPNIKIEEENRNIVYVENLLTEIKPYYLRLGNKK